MKNMKTILSNCSLFCGSYADVLSDFYGKVDLVVTSPPYNIGSKCPAKTGFRRLGKFDPKSYGSVRAYSDSKPELKYQEWQRDFLRWCFDKLLKPDGVLIYNHKNRHRGSFRRYGNISPYEWILPVQQEGKLIVREEIIWNRGSTHNHCTTYTWQETERIYVMQRPGANPYFKNIGFGDVWNIPLTPKVKRDCCFPPEIPTRCIKMWSQEGDLVCDPFSGSGTTMMAALSCGRKFVGSELQKDAFNLASSRLFKG